MIFTGQTPRPWKSIEQLLPLTNRASILLLLVGRLDREHGSWRLKFKAETDFGHRYLELQLAPARGVQNSQQLVEDLLTICDLPESLFELIVDRSDGNPFYLEELLRSLIDQGDLVKTDGSWRLTREVDDLEIPETLQGVLLARLDRLDEDIRRTLAARLGDRQELSLPPAGSDQRSRAASWTATWMSSRESTWCDEKSRLPELEYIFKHSLTQEAAYQSLLLERRREFHRRVALALEDLFAGRQEEYAGLLAHHYDLAGEQEKALEYLLPAGDKARLLNSFEEAQRFYHRALELLAGLGDQDREAHTWLKLGLVHQAEFQFEQSHHAFEKAFELQRKVRQFTKAPSPYVLSRCPAVSHSGRHLCQSSPVLDPGFSVSSFEWEFINATFAGLVEYDHELNILPHIARSWEVLDAGQRYLFHLRDDVRWTDGQPVTASDFEWAWKRNLAPGGPDYPANLLDDILGARAYRLGINPDPDQVGILALDPLTLEVRLETPIAYFIYLMALPVAFPLPRHVVQQVGDEWWKPPHVQSNGAFRLVEYTPNLIRFIRNPDYFGEFPGNLDGIDLHSFQYHDPAIVQQFLQDDLDVCVAVNLAGMPLSVPKAMQFQERTLSINALVFNPAKPPLDDPRIRRAIAQGLDYQVFMEMIFQGRDIQRNGGAVPSRMAGYSPELGLPFDLPLARRLLEQAGFPEGKGLPVLRLGFWAKPPGMDEMYRQFEANLGIHAEHISIPFPARTETLRDLHMTIKNWAVDYPDPDNVLRQSDLVRFPKDFGWVHPRFDQLIEAAAKSRDRVQRLALYREADRILVNEEVIVVPMSRGINLGANLIHPWVHGFEPHPLGLTLNHLIRLDRPS